jgi:hypothetical protein
MHPVFTARKDKPKLPEEGGAAIIEVEGQRE